MKRVLAPFILGRYQDLLQSLLVYGGAWLLVSVTEVLGWWLPVRGAAARLIEPGLVSTTALVELVTTPYSMAVKSYRAARRIQDLELKYSQSLAAISQLSALQEENKALRAMIENTDRSSQPVIISSPIMSLSRPAIAAGSRQGVEQGNLVVIAGTLVGRVNQVDEQVALIDLLTNRDAFPLVVTTPRAVEGIIQADGARLIMKEVPADAAIDIGERVVTVGQPGIPPDLFVGQVSQILTQPANPTKGVVIDQLVSFYQSRLVEVYK